VQSSPCFRRVCAAFGAVLAAGLAGCYHPSSTPERKASFAPYADLKLDEPSIGRPVSLEGYLALRSGLLTRAGTTGVSVGSVAAIDSRGYYLTAAHCVEGKAVGLQVPCVTIDRSSTPPVVKIEVTFRTAEVVWRGDVAKGEPDLAVLYDRRPPDAVFSWETDPKAGVSVVGAGVDYEKRIVDFTAGGLGGKLLGTQTMKSPIGPWTGLVTSLPAHAGDSGGAVATIDGHLLGITYAVRLGRFSGPRTTYASRPDLAWLRRIIDEDFAHRPADNPVAAFWRRPDQAEYLARLLVDGLRELETARLAANAPEDNRAGYNRQELVRKILDEQAGVPDEQAIGVVLPALPRISGAASAVSEDVNRVSTILRAKLQMK
jgi:hypothetical protein